MTGQGVRRLLSWLHRVDMQTVATFTESKEKSCCVAPKFGSFGYDSCPHCSPPFCSSSLVAAYDTPTGPGCQFVPPRSHCRHQYLADRNDLDNLRLLFDGLQPPGGRSEIGLRISRLDLLGDRCAVVYLHRRFMSL